MAPDVDMNLLNELYETISTQPPAVEARKILVEYLMMCNCQEAAGDAAKELLLVAPDDDRAKSWVATLCKDTPPKVTPPKEKAKSVPLSSKKGRVEPVAAIADENVAKSQQQMKLDYQKLQSDAKRLEKQFEALREIFKVRRLPTARCDKQLGDLTELANGRVSAVVNVKSPNSALSVARQLQASKDKALDIAIVDLSDMVRWLRCKDGDEAVEEDDIREHLSKRVVAITAVLPNDMHHVPSTALMHVEHEILKRKYVLTETMLGDEVADIERAKFLVTEDGYPWDMEELASALSANSGVMRNPLTKQLFTPADMRAIVNHPLGKALGALQVEQSTLKQGVRASTVKRLEEMSQILLADMSDDQLRSRCAVDEFLVYMATLPDSEQKALNNLKVPAKDSHTGQAFDATIGEAVRDAQGNRICFHKTADLLQQAAKYLR